MSAADTERYICSDCGYIYDPAVGDPMNTVPPGTELSDLPEAWVCPMCYAPTIKFDLLD